MKRILSAAFLCICVSFSTVQAESDLTIGVPGTCWKQLDQTHKIVYIKGIYTGVFFGDSPIKDDFYVKISYDHLVRALDQFYSNYKNEKIVVFGTLRIVAFEIKGIESSTIEKELKRLRELFSKY